MARIRMWAYACGYAYSGNGNAMLTLAMATATAMQYSLWRLVDGARDRGQGVIIRQRAWSMAHGMRQGTVVSPPKMCGKEDENDGAACNRT